MKFYFSLLSLLSLSCFAQSDSILIHFKPQSEDHCVQMHPQNGWYKAPKTLDNKHIKIPGAIYIEPTQLTDSQNGFTSFAWRPTFEANPYFDYPTRYYTEITAEEVNAILRDTISDYHVYAPKYTFRDVPKNPEHFLLHYGIIYDDNSVEERKAIERMEEEARQQRAREDSIRKAKCKERFGPECIGSIGVIDGVYTPSLAGRFYRMLPYESVHVENVHFVEEWHRELRATQFQPKVDELLQPFYLSQSEVSNEEYRTFVHWVRDSIAREMIFYNLEEDQEAFEWLDIPKASRACECVPQENGPALELSGREVYRVHFNLNWDKKIEYLTPETMELLGSLYLPQPERYYKRPEINYDLVKIDGVKAHPDSLHFDRIGVTRAALNQLYFNHPAYDEYPVLNLSYQQMQAYCKWKEQRINEELKSKKHRIIVEIPQIHHYEFAQKLGTEHILNTEIHDVTNDTLKTFTRDGAMALNYLNKVTQTSQSIKRKDSDLIRHYKAQYNGNIQHENTLFHHLHGNASEVVSDKITRKSLEHYQLNYSGDLKQAHYVIGANYLTDAKAISDEPYNAMFYKTVRNKESTDITTSFRLLYRVVPK